VQRVTLTKHPAKPLPTLSFTWKFLFPTDSKCFLSKGKLRLIVEKAPSFSAVISFTDSKETSYYKKGAIPSGQNAANRDFLRVVHATTCSTDPIKYALYTDTAHQRSRETDRGGDRHPQTSLSLSPSRFLVSVQFPCSLSLSSFVHVASSSFPWMITTTIIFLRCHEQHDHSGESSSHHHILSFITTISLQKENISSHVCIHECFFFTSSLGVRLVEFACSWLSWTTPC